LIIADLNSHVCVFFMTVLLVFQSVVHNA